MSTVTPYINLVKPAPLEPFSRATYNNNLDLIDTAIEAEAKKVKHVEYVRVGQNDMPANTMWGPGALAALVDGAVSLNYEDWISYPGNDQVRITKEGLYAVQWKMVPTSGSVTFWMGIGPTQALCYAGEFGRTRAASIPANDSDWTPNVHFFVPSAGQTLTFGFSSGTASATFNHRIKLTKLR